MSGQWPQPEDARGLGFDALALLAMQIVCPHNDTSKHPTEGGGVEYCNTCGAARRYTNLTGK